MSKIEDLQQSVREAVSNVDGISESLKAAREDLDTLTVALEGAVNAVDESTPEPARIGDVVEILKPTSGARSHVGLTAVVRRVYTSDDGFGIDVFLPIGTKPRNEPRAPIGNWSLNAGTYRVVARLIILESGSAYYRYPEVSS